MTHIEILEAIAQIYGQPRYLEIGVGDGGCFQRVARHCRSAVAVDVPDNPYGLEPAARVAMLGNVVFQGHGSDYFFDNYVGEPFDLVFIDGSHWADQVRRDWENSLQVLQPLGTIALHDTWAPTADLAAQGSDTAWQVADEIEQDARFEAYTLPVRPGLTLARIRRSRFQQWE